MKYSVEIWCSHKDHGNDDCITGSDWPTLDEATADLAVLTADPNFNFWRYACIEGPDGRVCEKTNPSPKIADQDLDDNEYAMMQGMAFGVDAYNEAKGWDTQEPDSGPRRR